ncbi:MAG: fibronectin type III domain-containing protein [Candidatus Thorarchaeota archaeon]
MLYSRCLSRLVRAVLISLLACAWLAANACAYSPEELLEFIPLEFGARISTQGLTSGPVQIGIEQVPGGVAIRTWEDQADSALMVSAVFDYVTSDNAKDVMNRVSDSGDPINLGDDGRIFTSLGSEGQDAFYAVICRMGNLIIAVAGGIVEESGIPPSVFNVIDQVDSIVSHFSAEGRGVSTIYAVAEGSAYGSYSAQAEGETSAPSQPEASTVDFVVPHSILGDIDEGGSYHPRAALSLQEIELCHCTNFPLMLGYDFMLIDTDGGSAAEYLGALAEAVVVVGGVAAGADTADGAELLGDRIRELVPDVDIPANLGNATKAKVNSARDGDSPRNTVIDSNCGLTAGSPVPLLVRRGGTNSAGSPAGTRDSRTTDNGNSTQSWVNQSVAGDPDKSTCQLSVSDNESESEAQFKITVHDLGEVVQCEGTCAGGSPPCHLLRIEIQLVSVSVGTKGDKGDGWFSDDVEALFGGTFSIGTDCVGGCYPNPNPTPPQPPLSTPPLPTPPEGVHVAPVSPSDSLKNQVTATPPPNSPAPVTHYNVYRTTAGTTGPTLVGTVSAETGENSISWIDEDVLPGTEYMYQVSAVAEGGESPLSLGATITTLSSFIVSVQTEKTSYNLGEYVWFEISTTETCTMRLIDHTPDGRTSEIDLGFFTQGTHRFPPLGQMGLIIEPTGIEIVEVLGVDADGNVASAQVALTITSDVPDSILQAARILAYELGREARNEGWQWEDSANCIDCCVQCVEDDVKLWKNSNEASAYMRSLGIAVYMHLRLNQSSAEGERYIARTYAEYFWKGYYNQPV